MSLMRSLRTTFLIVFAGAGVLLQQGCFVAQLAGAVGQNIERYKKIEVLAEYDGLIDKTCAVVVQCEPSILYENGSVYGTIAMNVSKRLQENVEGIKVLDFRQVMQWQYQTPSWSMLSYGEMAEESRTVDEDIDKALGDINRTNASDQLAALKAKLGAEDNAEED